MAIEFAPRDKLDLYPEGERRFWELIDVDGLATDESTLWDFDLTRLQYRELSKAAGVIVSGGMYVWKLAELLEKRNEDHR